MPLPRIAALATSLPVRILVSVGLLAIVAASIDWEAVSDGLAGASWGLCAAAIAIYFLGFIIASVRWERLLRAADIQTSRREVLRAYLIGMFANNVLPSGYGGDAVRAWVVSGAGKPLARALTSVVVDRGSALLCLLLLAWAAVIVKAGEIPGDVVLLLAIATAFVGAAGLAGLVIARRRGLGRFLPDAVRPWTGEVANVIRAYEHDRRLLAWVVVFGLLYQATVLSAFWLIAEALRLDLDPAVLAIVVPPALLAALLPISLAGFGVREGAFVVLLGEFGVSSADATLLSLLAVAGIAIASAPGGFAIALGLRPRKGGPGPNPQAGEPSEP